MTSTTATRRLGPGAYVTPEGHQILRVAEDARVAYGDGWHLIGPDGQWWQTYPTKRDALAAIPQED